MTDTALIGGILIAGTQSLITLSIFITSLVKSTPGSLHHGYRNSGLWLTIMGIVLIFVNIVHIFSSILLIIAGGLALQDAGREENQLRYTE